MKLIRLFFFFLFTILIIGQAKRPMLVEDLWLMERLNSFSLSPDGATIVYAATAYSMDLNKGNSDIYIMNADGSDLRALCKTEKNETNPKFTPDGRKVSYLCDGQLYTCDLDGTQAEQVTSIYTELDDYVWSPDGSKLLFTSTVYPDCPTQACNEERDNQKKNSLVKASLFTELMYRHWNAWREGKCSHLFFYDVKSKEAIDIIAGSKSDVPPIALGSAKDFTFSPDGAEIAFAMNPDKFIATSTNNEIYTVAVSAIKSGVQIPLKKISESKGNDNQPVYSPDGRYIAFVSMERAAFEADRQRLLIYDRNTGAIKDFTKGFDRSVEDMIWSPDSKDMYFICANSIYQSIYHLNLETAQIEIILNEGFNGQLDIDAAKKTLYFIQQRSTHPYEVFSLQLSGGTVKRLTNINTNRLAALEMNPVETFTCKGANGTNVESIILKPPFFDPKKKYPMIFLIHGGPQGHWEDDFHFRWNTQMFAAQGYVVVAPNPRGSTGYGQKFTDEISGDWGGKPYVDLMNVYDYAVKHFDFIDAKNTFAAGASYGGYMINWIAGHTDRFNALVSHAGVFDLTSKYGCTDELWFPEWEFKGAPWQNRKMYEKFSPHMYIQNCKTPMLVVHGAKDFRVTEGQAFELFTTLQRMGVESKFLYFPDETHFVAKPQNAKLWWKTVFNWFAEHYKK